MRTRPRTHRPSSELGRPTAGIAAKGQGQARPGPQTVPPNFAVDPKHGLFYKRGRKDDLGS